MIETRRNEERERAATVAKSLQRRIEVARSTDETTLKSKMKTIDIEYCSVSP